MTDLAEYPWKADNREVWANREPRERREFVGTMASAELAGHVAATHNAELVRRRLHSLPWRTGRHEDRHMYALLGSEASDGDPIVGTLDTAEAAKAACAAHNETLARSRAGITGNDEASS